MAMTRLRASLSFVVVVLVVAACQQPREGSETEEVRQTQARLEKLWPVPDVPPNEAERFWTFENGYLSFWEPDAATPSPVPGRNLASLHCTDVQVLSVEPDIVIEQDVNLSYPPFDVLTLEGGGLRLHTAIRRQSSGYTTWAAGDFKLRRAELTRILSAAFFVVRPVYVGNDVTALQDVDLGERYKSPPPPLREAFLASCSLG